MLREARPIALEDLPPSNPAANFTCCFCLEELEVYPVPTDTEASYRHKTVAAHVRVNHPSSFFTVSPGDIWIKPIYRRASRDLIADSEPTDGQ
jgi:hypothetical protein